jgi:putative ABC transport system substrate-binding protein
LVGLQPDMIVTGSIPVTAAVQRVTRTIPIVFVNGVDPVASGIVPRLNQPGGNITGFAVFETTLPGKWLELLSEIAPGLKTPALWHEGRLRRDHGYWGQVRMSIVGTQGGSV